MLGKFGGLFCLLSATSFGASTSRNHIRAGRIRLRQQQLHRRPRSDCWIRSSAQRPVDQNSRLAILR